MSEISPYDDEELSEHGLRIRCREFRAQLRERDAQCAAMRDAAMEVLASGAEGSLLGRRAVNDAALKALREALAPDAGKAMLERLEKAESLRSQAVQTTEAYDEGHRHGMNAGYTKALEDAAKEVEAMRDPLDQGLVIRDDAAAIRALKDGET